MGRGLTSIPEVPVGVFCNPLLTGLRFIGYYITANNYKQFKIHKKQKNKKKKKKETQKIVYEI